MTLEILQTEMISAMKAHNKEKKDVISTLIGAVKNAAIDKGCRDNIPESLVDEVLIKQQKVVQEQIDTCPAARADLLEKYTANLEIIKQYAPQLITDPEQIKAIILENIVENVPGQEFIKSNRGTLMRTLTPIFKGKADMKIVSTVLAGMLH